MDADRERLVELLVADLDRAPVEALIAEGRVDWRELAGEMATVKKEVAAEAAAKPLAVQPTPGDGKAGSHLKAMTTLIGVPACQSCGSDAAEMDAKGVAWCREHLDELVARIEPRAQRLGWVAKAKAGALALSHGLPLSVRGMVEEAIRRAEGSPPA